MTREREKKTLPEHVTAQVTTNPRRWRAPFVLPVHCGFCGQVLPDLVPSIFACGQTPDWILDDPSPALWRNDAGAWRPTIDGLSLRARNKDDAKECERLLSNPSRLNPDALPAIEHRLAELRGEIQDNRFKRQRRRLSSAPGSRALPARVMCSECGVENLVPIPGIDPVTGR